MTLEVRGRALRRRRDQQKVQRDHRSKKSETLDELNTVHVKSEKRKASELCKDKVVCKTSKLKKKTDRLGKV